MDSDDDYYVEELDFESAGSSFINVSCDLDGEWTQAPGLDRLVTLNLHSNPLVTGNAPSFVGAMSSLHELDMESCGLDGSIPAAVGTASALTNFLLSHNSLQGTLPESLGLLTSVRNFEVCIDVAGFHSQSARAKIPRGSF